MENYMKDVQKLIPSQGGCIFVPECPFTLSVLHCERMSFAWTLFFIENSLQIRAAEIINERKRVQQG